MMSEVETKRRIGILGGMGPEATVLLMARIVARTSASDDCDHVPLIIDNNTQVPSRIKALLEKSGDDPGPVLADMASKLEACGAKALAMPCNTAHHYAPAINKAVNIPLLNMVDLAVASVDAMKLINRRVGILASPAVQLTGLFDRAFLSRQIETQYPVDQNRMLTAIRLIKSNGNELAARKVLQEAACELIKNKSDCLLIACSELSIIADAVPPAFARLDTIDILADEIIRFSGAIPANV